MSKIHKNVRHYKALNNFLDHFSHLHIKIFGQKYPTYKVCGISGYILALILGALLVIYLDLSFGIAFLLLFTTFATFVFMAMIIKIISHKERLIFYHHLITVFLTTALVLWLLKQPVFAYLDIIALGFGTFLVCCRIGCLMVGCCHGKPHSWGICYGQKHVDKGFTGIFQGIRLFPVQALELLWVFLITIVGIFLIVFRAPAGETFLWYIMTYCMGRFFIEFLRGDFGRTYFYGFSEAQWTSISLMFIALGIEWQIRDSFHIWHIIICIFCLLIMIILSVLRNWPTLKTSSFWHPQDYKDFAERLNELNRYPQSQITVMETKQGIQISSDKIVKEKKCVILYSISQKNNFMTKKFASRIGKHIQLLRHPNLPFRTISGNNNVFHILFQDIVFQFNENKKHSLS